jgi:hypothetical protein
MLRLALKLEATDLGSVAIDGRKIRPSSRELKPISYRRIDFVERIFIYRWSWRLVARSDSRLAMV